MNQRKLQAMLNLNIYRVLQLHVGEVFLSLSPNNRDI
jgi:hypothetical protein